MATEQSSPATGHERSIFSFWAPLALTWGMMAAEGPTLTALISRAPDPKHNLAAFGVAFALSLVIEAPVLMLLSATAALVRDKASFQLLRRFTISLNWVTSIGMILSAVNPFFQFTVSTLLDLDPVLHPLIRYGLLVMAPWPAAIGYRRFCQGILLQARRPDIVARCTIVRVAAMASSSFALFHIPGLPGVLVGCGGLSAAVVAEALAAGWAARPYARKYLAESGPSNYPLSFRDLIAFYIPLSLTSFVGLSTSTIYSFFLSRSVLSLESLAVMPVVNALAWMVQSVTLALEETVIVLSGDRLERLPSIRKFGATLAAVLISILALLSLTPLSALWFSTISRLPSDLIPLAQQALAILILTPAIRTANSIAQALLIKLRRTIWVTAGTILDVSLVICGLSVNVFVLKLPGYQAAPLSQLTAATLSSLFSVCAAARVMRRARC